MMMCAPYAWRSSLSKTLGKPHVAGKAKLCSRHSISSQQGQHNSVACFMISEVHFKGVHPCNAPSFCVIWKCCVKVTNAARITYVLLQAPLPPSVHYAVGPEVRAPVLLQFYLLCPGHSAALLYQTTSFAAGQENALSVSDTFSSR